MTEIKKLKNKLLEFNKNSDYLFSDNSKGKKSYTIYSEKLKQSLREIIHSKAGEEWQIKHVLGENFIEYRIERNSEFGLYRKNLAKNSPDEFVTVSEGQNSLESEGFTNEVQSCEEARQKTEIARKKIEMIRKKNDQRNEDLKSNVLGENCISITLQKSKEDERMITMEENYNDSNQAQKIREGWGFNFTKEMLSEWFQKQKNSQENIQKVINGNNDNKNKKDQKLDKNSNQQNQSQKPNNKDNNNKNIYYGVGLVSLILLVISIVAVRMKRKR